MYKMKEVLCPKCKSNNIESIDLIDILDLIDEDDYNLYYLALYSFVCHNCGHTFYSEYDYIESKDQVYRKEECI